MRILFATPFEPLLDFGGGRLVAANLASLCSLDGVTVDFIGPALNPNADWLAGGKLGKVFTRPFTCQSRIAAALTGNTSSLYSVFKEWQKANQANQYDVIFVESTRCGFIPKAFHGAGKVVVMVHNVEKDFLQHNQQGVGRIANAFIPASERKSLRYADKILALHQEDADRLSEIYGAWVKERVVIHPVCSFAPKETILPWASRERIVLFIGSLHQNYNIIGATQFIKECLPSVKSSGYKLIIAGRNPPPSFVDFCRKFQDVVLIPNPKSAEELVRTARVLILPDLTGTGMKLRVAEAMSLGVPIVGTQAGLRGYNNISEYGIATKDITGMGEALLELLKEGGYAASKAQKARELWEKEYSFEAFKKRIKCMVKP